MLVFSRLTLLADQTFDFRSVVLGIPVPLPCGKKKHYAPKPLYEKRVGAVEQIYTILGSFYRTFRMVFIIGGDGGACSILPNKQNLLILP